MNSFPRQSRSRGGGIATVCKSTLGSNITFKTNFDFTHTSFGVVKASITLQHNTLHFFCPYRPPPNRQNNLTDTMFTEQLPDFLDYVDNLPGFVGDVNIHFDNPLESKAASRPESGVWLNCAQNNRVGTFIDNDTLRIGVALRVGLTVCIPHRCKCGTTVDTFGTHPLSCRFSAGRIPRHSALNDVVRRGLSAAGIPSMLEPSGLDRGDGKRPDGITVYPYSRGRCLIWDATCVNTFASSNLIRAALTAWSDAAEVRKIVKYAELGRRFTF